MLSSNLIKRAVLKVYKGAPHGMCTTRKDKVDADLLDYIEAKAGKTSDRDSTRLTEPKCNGWRRTPAYHWPRSLFTNEIA